MGVGGGTVTRRPVSLSTAFSGAHLATEPPFFEGPCPMEKDSSLSDSHNLKKRHRHNLEPEARSLATEESTKCQGAAGCPASNFIPNGDNDDEGRSTIPDASEQDMSDEEKIYPLSGKPFFSSILTKSQVQAPYQLIPPKHIWPFLPSASVPALLCKRAKTWKMKYHGDRRQKRFDGGWKSFVIDNNLKIGDGCVFELMEDENLTFQVQILRGGIPPEFANNGLSPDKPLLID